MSACTSALLLMWCILQLKLYVVAAHYTPAGTNKLAAKDNYTLGYTEVEFILSVPMVTCP